MARGLLLLALAAAALSPLPGPARAQAAAFCSPGAAPGFSLGFAALAQALGGGMGEATECEHGNPANGDTLQATTAGLAYYRRCTNTPTFTDGDRHWALTPAGLTNWAGASVDPPDAAVCEPTAGADVAWPQCGAPLPPVGAFGIVGVSAGLSFSQNPCLADEYRWAAGAAAPPSVYMNLNGAVSTTDPSHVQGPQPCAAGDEGCRASNYGWNAAAAAYAYATSQGLQASSWWLDVETANSWLDRADLNVRTIQAAVDFLRSEGLEVGIYSNAAMWDGITGGWRNGLPVWYAGTSSVSCGNALPVTGGPLRLVQQAPAQAGGDLACDR